MRATALILTLSLVGMFLAAAPTVEAAGPFVTETLECAKENGVAKCAPTCLIGSDGDCVIPIYCVREPCP